MVQEKCRLLSSEQVAPGHWVMRLAAPAIASFARAGQFVHVRIPTTYDPLLRRPISIMLPEARQGNLRLLTCAVGRGARMLVETPLGTELDLLGPLGTAFPLPGEPELLEAKEVLLVAGGMGVAPLVFLADTLRGRNHHAYVRGLFGAATEDLLVSWTEFAARCDEFYVSTEDGSAGEQDRVTDTLVAQLERGQADVVYTCGPIAMMAQVAQMCHDAGVACYCSFEQRMGCGVGACLSCAVPAAGGGYVRVCRDGPVFAADRLDWEAILDDI